jgi:hypothetical protein
VPFGEGIVRLVPVKQRVFLRHQLFGRGMSDTTSCGS